MPRWLILSHKDADGVLSAGIFGWYLNNIRHSDTDVHIDFRFIEHTETEWWSDEPGTSIWASTLWKAYLDTLHGVALLDLPLMPVPSNLNLAYVDHHPSWGSKSTYDPTSLLESLRPSPVIVEPDATSTARLLIEFLLDRNPTPTPLKRAAIYADRIDTVDFDQPAKAIAVGEYMPATLMHLSVMAPEETLVSIAGDIARGRTLNEALGGVDTEGLFREFNETIEASGLVIREAWPSISLLDWTQLHGRSPIRFAPDFHLPSCRFAIQIEHGHKPGQIMIRVGRSPWHPPEPCDPDLGEIMTQYDGGGHPFAAGCQIPGTDAGEFQRDRVSQIVTEVADQILQGRGD